MAIIMGKGCLEAIYGLMGWKGVKLIFHMALFCFFFLLAGGGGADNTKHFGVSAFQFFFSQMKIVDFLNICIIIEQNSIFSSFR